MATVTHVFTIDYVAELLNEDLELLRKIVRNDDNLSYGNIVTVSTGDDETITTSTDNGIEELAQLLADNRRSPETWSNFFDTLDPW